MKRLELKSGISIMTDKLPRVFIENDSGTLYATFPDGELSTDYFYEAYYPASEGGYGQGYTDGYEAAMNKVRKVTYD